MESDYQEYRLSVCVLASGSKGNAIYVSDGKTNILVDAGLSGSEIIRRLTLKGLNPNNLTGIIVTHEHTDHVRGVGVLSRKFGLPIYMSRQTGNWHCHGSGDCYLYGKGTSERVRVADC